MLPIAPCRGSALAAASLWYILELGTCGIPGIVFAIPDTAPCQSLPMSWCVGIMPGACLPAEGKMGLGPAARGLRTALPSPLLLIASASSPASRRRQVRSSLSSAALDRRASASSSRTATTPAASLSRTTSCCTIVVPPRPVVSGRTPPPSPSSACSVLQALFAICRSSALTLLSVLLLTALATSRGHSSAVPSPNSWPVSPALPLGRSTLLLSAPPLTIGLGPMTTKGLMR